MMVLVVSGFVLFLSAGNSIYQPTGYDESTLSSFNKMDELTTIVEDTKTKSYSISSQAGVLDILGSFFNSAYQAVKAAGKIIDIFVSMITDSTQILTPLVGGAFAGILSTAINLIMIILIIVGILLAIITKSNRT